MTAAQTLDTKVEHNCLNTGKYCSRSISGQRQQTKRSQHRVRSVLGAQSRDSYFTLGCQGRFSEK